MLVNFVARQLGESIVDNVIKDRVLPVPGSILYCDLALSTMEHTGIYIGNNEIVHLDGSGMIEKVTPKKFLDRLNGFNTALTIYVSSKNGIAVGDLKIAERALNSLGRSRSYNFILDNCHQFTSGCISGDFNNPHNFLWMVKSEAKKALGTNEWRAWETFDGTHISFDGIHI